jgi:Flp pilus assembly protein TadB
VSDKTVVKEELEAAIAARTEMGAEMEPAVIDAFVARIERRLVERGDQDERALKRQRDHEKEMVLGSMGISVPLFAIAAIFTGLAGVVAVLVALVVITVVSARRR